MINLYYDDLKYGNGVGNEIVPPVRPNISITTHLDWCQIPFSKKTMSNTVNNSDTNLYVIELFHVDRIDEIFQNIPKETIDFIKINNLKILIYFPTEGFDFTLYNNWFLNLHQCFRNYKLSNVKKYFIFNNLIIDKLYNEFVNANGYNDVTFCKVFGYCFFHLEYYNVMQDRWKLNPSLKKIESVDTTKILNKQRDFLSLNAKIRGHRLLLVSELKRRNLIKNSYTSFVGTDIGKYHGVDIKYSYDSLIEFFEEDQKSARIIPEITKEYVKKFAEDWHPIILDSTGSDIYASAKGIIEYYEKSYFSIVTETGMGTPLRITEKTFKPIANYQPFIVLGNKGTLKYLKSLGYETFSEMFDESYDQEEKITKRFLMVLDEIEKFCNLSVDEKNKKFTKIYDKLLHNANLFYNILPEKTTAEFRNIFEEIKNDN
jgi:hypothetical protein